jgi:hypothetical protein
MEILLEDYAPDAIILTDLDEAIIGIVESFGGGSRILYDKNKILDLLMERDGMTHSESEEYYDFNIIGGYFGEMNPVFLDRTVKMVEENKKTKFVII